MDKNSKFLANLLAMEVYANIIWDHSTNDRSCLDVSEEDGEVVAEAARILRQYADAVRNDHTTDCDVPYQCKECKDAKCIRRHYANNI